MKSNDVIQRKLPEMMLAETLVMISDNDQNYDTRNVLIVRAMDQALQCGYEVGIGFDPLEPYWPVVFIELPTGQVSWHVPPHTKRWDSHNGDTKVIRVVQYANAVLRGL